MTLGAALCAALASGSAQAQSCGGGVSLSVGGFPTPQVDYSESMSNLTNIDRGGFSFFPFGSVVLGLYQPFPSVELLGSATVAKTADGGYLACLSGMRLSYSFNPVIHVARELAQQAPCVAQQILEHEMGHHSIQSDVMRSAAVAQSPSRTLVQNPVEGRGRTPEEAAANLELMKARFVQQAREDIWQIAMQPQSGHDNQGEYHRLALSCNGELQELLKNNWSGYIYK